MQPVTITKQLIAGDDDRIAASQAVAAAGYLNLNGVTGTGNLDTQRNLIITSSGNDTGRTFTVIGKSQSGTPIKETVTGANAGAASTTIDFLSVDSVYASGAVAGTVKVGTNAIGSTPWQRFDPHMTPSNLSFAIYVAGDANAGVQYTFDEFLQAIPANGVRPAVYYAPDTVDPVVYNHPILVNLTVGNYEGRIGDQAIRGWRINVQSGTGLVTCVGTQSGMAGP